ncbi:MAG: hypothetical protein JNL88_01015, partial [Bacteroidia bacterium]|nr:hypothetical protein [Bacteroidia bacterium]
MDKVNDTLCFFDIRFGKTDLRSVQGNEKTFVFYFKLTEPKARPLVIRQYVSGKDMKFSEFMKQIFSRIFHEF